MKIIITKMLFAILLICLLFSIAGCCYEMHGEGPPNSGKDSKYTEEDIYLLNQLREDYNFGTCKELSGNISVVLFYMDDFESEWTDTEIDQFTKNEVMPGLAFLEQESKKYGIEFNHRKNLSVNIL